MPSLQLGGTTTKNSPSYIRLRPPNYCSRPVSTLGSIQPPMHRWIAGPVEELDGAAETDARLRET